MIAAFILTLLAASPVAASIPATPQGSAEDYQRAAELRGKFSGKLNRHDVKQSWLDDGRLLYSVSTEQGGFELILVDPQAEASARKQVLLKKEQLLEFLKASGLPSKSARVVRMAPSPSALHLMLADAGGVIRFDLNDQSMEVVPPDDAHDLHLQPRDSFARSRDRGGRTAIHMLNQLAHEVEIVWVDRSGNEKSYGKIAPGKDHWMSTFAGHGFRLKEADGKVRFHFVGEAQPGIAVISEQNLPQETPTGRKSRPQGLGNPNKGEAKSKRGKTSQKKQPYRHDLKRTGRQEHTVSFVESSPEKQLQPVLHQFDYLKPGDDLGKFELSILGPDADGKQQVRVIENSLFPNPWSLSRFQWSDNGTKLRFLYNQRGHQILRLLEVDAGSGRVRTLVEEQSPTFLDYAGKTYLQLMEPRQEALWMSERDGWNHLYLIDLKKGGIKRQLTSGEWMVRSVEKVNVEKGEALIKVMGIHPKQDPYHVHFATLDLNSGDLTILTDGDGTHQIEWSPDGRYFVDRYSRVDMPTHTELRNRQGELVCRLERGNLNALLEAGWRLPQRFAAKGRDGQSMIWGVVYRPTNFSARRKYPVVESIYAGPHGAHVPKSFSVHRKAMELAELGFVVVQIDGMGTNWRGKKFHDVAWKNLHDAGFPDRKLWIKELASKDAALDLTRVGIYGGSAGGQNAMRALIDHHDFYQVAVADCGCHDNRMDKIWWNELWMGWPVDDSYSQASNVDQAHRMQGDLMLVVGELDRNVDPASTMQVVDALIQADKDFDLLVVPGGGHGIAETKYGTRRRRDYFVRKLLEVEPRWK
jgi:dipeptidyl-peptidase 4